MLLPRQRSKATSVFYPCCFMLGVETQGRCPKQSFQDSRCFRVAASGFVKRCVFICICEVSVDRKTKVSRVAKAEAEAVKRGHWLPFSLARRSFSLLFVQLCSARLFNPLTLLSCFNWMCCLLPSFFSWKLKT